MITPSGREALLVEHPYLRWDDTMYKVETEQEVDGRWIAEVPELPGVLAYGQSRDEAVRKAQALSLHVLAELLDNGEPLPQVQNVFSIVA
jgi:predicted RNase H-like HicB family nuclease